MTNKEELQVFNPLVLYFSAQSKICTFSQIVIEFPNWRQNAPMCTLENLRIFFVYTLDEYQQWKTKELRQN